MSIDTGMGTAHAKTGLSHIVGNNNQWRICWEAPAPNLLGIFVDLRPCATTRRDISIPRKYSGPGLHFEYLREVQAAR